MLSILMKNSKAFFKKLLVGGGRGRGSISKVGGH